MNGEETVIEILKDLSGEETIGETDTLKEDIHLDSLGMVTLLVEIEDVFDIRLDESDMNPFDLIAVQDVVNLVGKYIGDRNE